MLFPLHVKIKDSLTNPNPKDVVKDPPRSMPKIAKTNGRLRRLDKKDLCLIGVSLRYEKIFLYITTIEFGDFVKF